MEADQFNAFEEAVMINSIQRDTADRWQPSWEHWEMATLNRPLPATKHNTSTLLRMQQQVQYSYVALQSYTHKYVLRALIWQQQ